MDSRSRTSRSGSPTTSTGSGTGCRRTANMAPPVRRVDIPKANGGTRPLVFRFHRSIPKVLRHREARSAAAIQTGLPRPLAMTGRRCSKSRPRETSVGIGTLGIPTVADRIAQEVVRRRLEPLLEPLFHADSYGYRPRRSAIDAVRTARQRCWRYDWVLDIDIKGFFDSIDWTLLLRAVRRHTDCPWVLLYIERWLKAPVQMEDGSVVPRTA